MVLVNIVVYDTKALASCHKPSAGCRPGLSAEYVRPTHLRRRRRL